MSAPERASARAYRVTHVTDYDYSEDVTASYGRAHLLPRSGAGQLVRGSRVELDPPADELRSHTDFFGNQSTYFAIRTPHRRLRVSAVSEVDVDRAAPEAAYLDELSWEHLRDAPRDADTSGFELASPLVRPTAAVADYARESFPAGRPFGTALTELLHRIHADLEYAPGATTVKTTLGELLHRRQGVCQDFAHLLVGGLRALGLPARYVSGYLETIPPPGRPKLQGADASHAWASVWLPGGEWVDLDPTNDQYVDDRYVVTGWGRDYTDVPPLKGVILTDSRESRMAVSVDVTRIG